MTKEEVLAVLAEAGHVVNAESRLPNDSGFQLRLRTGQTVSVFDTGRCLVQGKNPEAIQALLAAHDDGTSFVNKARPEASRKVFVVYGHDERARNDLEAMLRRWRLEPLILDQLPSGGQTIIEKLESVRGEAMFAVVLSTPDDEGHRAGHPEEKTLRARQNVVLELGMMLAVLGRHKVAILLKDQALIERPSDIQGLIYLPFKDAVKEAALSLAKEMNAQGIKIDLDKI